MVAAILLISVIMFGICLYLANECHPTCTPKAERYSLASLMAIVVLVDLAILEHPSIPRVVLLLTFLGMVSILLVLINQIRKPQNDT